MVYDSRKKYQRLFRILEARYNYDEDMLNEAVDDIILKCYPYKLGADGSDEYNIKPPTANLDKWAEKNLTSKYIVFRDGGYFKSEQDAILFKLTWG